MGGCTLYQKGRKCYLFASYLSAVAVIRMRIKSCSAREWTAMFDGMCFRVVKSVRVHFEILHYI